MKYFIMLVFLGCGVVDFAQSGSEIKINILDKSSTELNTRLIDSLKKTLAGANQNQLFDIQFNLFREYLEVNKDSSSFYLERAFKHASKNGDSIDLVFAYNAMGSMSKSDGNIVKAIKIYERALGIAKRNEFKRPIKFLLNNLALSYTLIASYDTALAYNFESLKIREIEGNSVDIYVALNNIGYLYEELGDYENALLYYNMGYNVKVENNVNYELDLSLVNIARAMNRLGKYKEAEQRISQAFNICKNSECKPENLMTAFQVIGEALFEQRQLNQAEYYFNKSLKLSIKYEISEKGNSSIDSRSSCYYWLALIRFNKGKFVDAINYLNSSQQVAVKAGLQRQILLNFDLYSKISFEEKDYKKAFEYQNKFQQIKSDIHHISVLRRISKIHADYTARENKVKMESQEKIMKLQEETISQHKSLNYLIGMVAFLTLGLAVIFYRMNLQKQEVNRILDQRVKDRTIELERNRDKLKHSHDEQSIVLKNVSNDLTSALATLKGLSNLAEKHLPHNYAVHFKQAVLTSERITNYVKVHIPQDLVH